MKNRARIRPQTKKYSRDLRFDMSEAEKHLWRCLRLRQMEGYKFRRQHPVGRYILDFVCLEAGLVIELDGGQHSEQQGYDEVRSEWLQQQGLRVIRFWNHEVLTNIEGVKAAIYQALKGDSAVNQWKEQG